LSSEVFEKNWEGNRAGKEDVGSMVQARLGRTKVRKRFSVETETRWRIKGGLWIRAEEGRKPIMRDRRSSPTNSSRGENFKDRGGGPSSLRRRGT